MEPKDSVTAPEEAIVAEDVVEDKPNYATPNDLDFVLTEEQEADYIKQILDNGRYEPPVEVKEEPVAPVIEPVTPDKVETPVEPVKEEPKVEEVSTPQTDDLWIEVEQTTTDDLGEETTRTVKLTYDPADPSSFIPDDFTAKNTKQLADIMDAKAEMAKLYGEREGEFEQSKAANDKVAAETALIKGWDTEIADLIGAGAMEAPKVAETDPTYKQDPSVIMTEAVFGFMTKQNEARMAEGRPVITSFGTAFTLYQNDAKRIQDAKDKVEEDKKVKQAGAMIGGGSGTPRGGTEAKAYKSGSYGSIWDVPVED